MGYIRQFRKTFTVTSASLHPLLGPEPSRTRKLVHDELPLLGGPM